MTKSRWDMFCDLVSGPLVSRLHFVLVVASVGWFFLTYRDFTNYYELRKSDHVAANVFANTMCIDPQTVVLAKKEDECRNAARVKELWPGVWALYDILEDWRLCGRGGCLQLLDGFASHYIVKLAVVIGMLYVILLVAMWLGIRQQRRRAIASKFDLPSDGMSIASFNDVSYENKKLN